MHAIRAIAVIGIATLGLLLATDCVAQEQGKVAALTIPDSKPNLVIEIQKELYERGEEIEVKARIRAGSEPLRFWRDNREGKNGVSHIHFAPVPTKTGQVVNTNVDFQAETIVGGGEYVTLAPGKEMQYQFCLNEWFYLAPGEYAIKARFDPGITFNSKGEDYTGRFHIQGAKRVPTPPGDVLVSNEVTVKVSPDGVGEKFGKWAEVALDDRAPVEKRVQSLEKLAFTYDPKSLSLLENLAKGEKTPILLKNEAARWIPRYKEFERQSK